MVRRVLAFCAVALVLASMAAGAHRPVRLPRDHFGHPQSGIEWWYFSALVRDPRGTPYSVFYTMFSSRGGLIPVSQVVNLATGAVIGHSEGVALGRPGTRKLDLPAAETRLRYLAKPNSWSFSVRTASFAVSLRQHPLKAYTRHGDRGLIPQSAAGVSHYYSSTRMRATGTLRIGTATSSIRGQSWFDHQWGNYVNDPRAFNWAWFSCRFDDNTELMLYQFLDPITHQALEAYRSGTYISRTGETSRIKDFSASAGSRTLTDSGQTWPLDWTLSVSRPALRETLISLQPDQLVRNRILPTFWEGVATATGTRQGSCFVEITYR
jgi:predicted secreted hydrolase